MGGKKITMEEFLGNKVNKFQLVEMRENLDNFKAALGMHIEFIEISAKATKAKYDALLKEGFTEQQALQLCKD